MNNMQNLLRDVKKLQKTAVKKKVERRLKEFASFKNKNSKKWFSELCFCILTANSKAKTALQIEKELGVRGFCYACASDVKRCIINNKHRFHNNKTRFIVSARQHMDIKSKLKGKSEKDAREWIVKNIKGLGYKESSHFLRNVGYKNLAIVDRHIINLMAEHNLIDKPKTVTKKIYLEIEEKFKRIAKRLNMSAAELDIYMWYLKTGAVLK